LSTARRSVSRASGQGTPTEEEGFTTGRDDITINHCLIRRDMGLSGTGCGDRQAAGWVCSAQGFGRQPDRDQMAASAPVFVGLGKKRQACSQCQIGNWICLSGLLIGIERMSVLQRFTIGERRTQGRLASWSETLAKAIGPMTDVGRNLLTSSHRTVSFDPSHAQGSNLNDQCSS